MKKKKTESLIVHDILRKQVSYHFSLTKIQKLQNFKKKKKKKRLFPVPTNMPKIGQYGRYLNRYEIVVFQYQCTYQNDKYQLCVPEVRLLGLTSLGLTTYL